MRAFPLGVTKHTAMVLGLVNIGAKANFTTSYTWQDRAQDS